MLLVYSLGVGLPKVCGLGTAWLCWVRAGAGGVGLMVVDLLIWM